MQKRVYMNSHTHSIVPSWLLNFKELRIFIFDADGTILDSSDSFKEIFFQNGSADISHIRNIFDTKDAARFIAALKDTSNTIQQNDTTKIIVLQDISTIRHTCEYYSISATSEEKKLFAGIITQHDEMSRIIEYNKEWIDTFFNNSPGSAWITNEAGEMLLMNTLSKDLVGLGNDYKSKTLWDIYPKEIADIFHENNRRVIETNEMLVTEESFIDKYGRPRTSLVYKFPLKTKGNKKVVGGWSIDITERKNAEQKILEHNLKIKELAFLQSHEVRRPLANIMGLIQLINSEQKDINDDELKRLLLYINASAHELDDVIKKVIRKLQEE